MTTWAGTAEWQHGSVTRTWKKKGGFLPSAESVRNPDSTKGRVGRARDGMANECGHGPPTVFIIILFKRAMATPKRSTGPATLGS